MAHYDPAVIEKYRSLLKKDPSSQVFAPLADAYRDQGDMVLAEKIVREGLRRHPQFAGGLLVLAKILRDQKKLDEALSIAQKAARLSPDNLLAHQLEGDFLLELKRPQDALKAYKTVLFLNPHSVKARRVVQKLESLTAADYEEDVFEMSRIEKIDVAPERQVTQTGIVDITQLRMKTQIDSQTSASTRTLQRVLSLLDAFIVRNDLTKAQEILRMARIEFGDQPELDHRDKLLKNRTQTSLLGPAPAQESALPLKPRESREKEIAQIKIQRLQMLLRKIESFKSPI